MTVQGRGVGFARVCLWGDHCDWARRQVIASSIDRRITTVATRSDDDMVHVSADNLVHGLKESASFEVDHATEIPLRGSSLKYVNAVYAALLERFPDLKGSRLSITSDVPMRRGLSSSAALCVSVTSALSDLFRLGLTPDDLVRISYRAERGILGIGCGMMDQTASVFDHPLFMDFSKDFSYQRVSLRREIPIIIADVGGERDTRKILNTLNQHYFERQDPLIVRTLGTDIPRIVRKARAEMEGRCSLERLGQLMDENQACYDRGLRPFCESELGSPLLYRALQAAREGGAFGAKWTGAGGSGSIVAVASAGRIEELAAELMKVCRGVIRVSVGRDANVSKRADRSLPDGAAILN